MAFLVTKFCHPKNGEVTRSCLICIDDGFCSVIGKKEALEAVQTV